MGVLTWGVTNLTVISSFKWVIIVFLKKIQCLPRWHRQFWVEKVIMKRSLALNSTIYLWKMTFAVARRNRSRLFFSHPKAKTLNIQFTVIPDRRKQQICDPKYCVYSYVGWGISCKISYLRSSNKMLFYTWFEIIKLQTSQWTEASAANGEKKEKGFLALIGCFLWLFRFSLWWFSADGV